MITNLAHFDVNDLPSTERQSDDVVRKQNNSLSQQNAILDFNIIVDLGLSNDPNAMMIPIWTLIFILYVSIVPG